MKLPVNVSQSVKRRNPELYDHASLAPVVVPVRESSQKSALVKDLQAKPSRKNRVVAVVTLIDCRRRLLDSDNYVAGFKALRDAIAQSIGVDDGDPRIRWEYGQVRCEGKPGTIIRISIL